MSTPFSAATSIITPRVISAPTFSIPNLVNPPRLDDSSTLKQLYMLFSWVWCAKPSSWVPT